MSKKIVLEKIAPKLRTDELAALSKFVKSKMKESFEAGARYGHSHYTSYEYNDDAGFKVIFPHKPTSPDFKNWFKQKYK